MNFAFVGAIARSKFSGGIGENREQNYTEPQDARLSWLWACGWNRKSLEFTRFAPDLPAFALCLSVRPAGRN